MEMESTNEGQEQTEPVAEITDMEALLEEHFDYAPPRPGDICTGTIIKIDDQGALVDIGYKREGFVPQDDLERMRRARMEPVEVGDQVPVLVLRPREGHEYVPLSIYKARMAEDWLRAEEMLESRQIYETEVVGYNRGGLIVHFGRIRGFVPISHIVGLPRRLSEEQRKERLRQMVGRTVGLRVIEVDRRRRRLIFSQRQAYRAWQRMRKRRLLEELQVGERRRGVVSSIVDFGVFVDLGGADGLVHVSELSWGRVDDPREVVNVGDEVEVVVLDVDRQHERIALSIKKTQEDPWESVDQRYYEGQLVEGTVTQVSSLGAFVELEPGIEGLLHASELVGAPAVVPEEVLQPRDRVLVKVIRVEKHRRRIGLSARRVRREEWEAWAAEQAARREQKEGEPVEAEAAERETAPAPAPEMTAEGESTPVPGAVETEEKSTPTVDISSEPEVALAAEASPGAVESETAAAMHKPVAPSDEV
ncbi:MAG TPA: S1 RNA-binding domain-containing protein [Anaerolineales bacterium]|nr:S1 RNA-binding domain-containing protein [Anaerolineales bacterium]